MEFLKKKINTDKAINSQPWFIYRELEWLSGQLDTYFTYTIDDGYNYYLELISYKYNDLGILNPLRSEPKFELINSKRGRPEQDNPIPFSLFSSPGPSGDPKIGKAAELKSRLYLNKYFQYRETIEIKCSRELVDDNETLQLLLCGYLIPVEGE